jgi:hypothetical protein
MPDNKFAIYTEPYMPEDKYILASSFHTLKEAQALVSPGQVIVEHGTDWPKDQVTFDEIQHNLYKKEITNMTKETQVEKAKAEKAEGEQAEKRILAIMDTLIYLRVQTDKLSMKKAELLVEVKDGKLYKEDFGNFGAFCDAIGYHRSTVSTLIDCYRIPQLRENYPAIGARAGKILVQAKNTGMNDDQLSELITFASNHKSNVACQHITHMIAEHCRSKMSESADDEQEGIESLPKALVRQAALIKRRKVLVEELDQINEMLKSLAVYITKLSTDDSISE